MSSDPGRGSRVGLRALAILLSMPLVGCSRRFAPCAWTRGRAGPSFTFLAAGEEPVRLCKDEFRETWRSSFEMCGLPLIRSNRLDG